MGREDEIRLIAYKIWEEEGCVDRNDYEHWFRAEVIWEEQREQKTFAQRTKTASKKSAKRNIEAKAAKRRLNKT